MSHIDLGSYFGTLREGAGIPWEAFDGASVLVTGATGLVGFNVIGALLAGTAHRPNPPRIWALVRDRQRAEARFADLASPQLSFVEGDVCTPLDDELARRIAPDFIIHAAARTDSAGMVGEPLSVITTALEGTFNMMELARAAKCRKVVYVSSMEVYGAHESEQAIDEHTYGPVDPLSVRSSYPESKKMSENICVSYHSQHGVNVCIARLAQTFGVGIPANDQRVFAYFARCALERRDIELATEGTSTRMYVSALDAAAALLILLANGEAGGAYNIANEDTYCSIREMAELVRNEIAQGEIGIRVKENLDGRYPPTHHLRLDTSRIKALGWKPTMSLAEMFESILPGLA